MSDEKAVLSERRRRPGAHARIGPRLVEIDRRAATRLVEAGIGRKPCLMRPPAELGRLHALGEKALDRPGVDEDIARLRLLGALRVALGDMDALDAEALGELAPFLLALRLAAFVAEIGGEIDQGLLDEPRHHAGIGAAAGNRRRAARLAAARFENRLAQGVVRAGLRPETLVEVEAGPGLNDRIDIERADLAAMLHQR